MLIEINNIEQFSGAPAHFTPHRLTRNRPKSRQLVKLLFESVVHFGVEILYRLSTEVSEVFARIDEGGSWSGAESFRLSRRLCA